MFSFKNINRKELLQGFFAITGLYIIKDFFRPLNALAYTDANLTVVKGKDLSSTTVNRMVRTGFSNLGGIHRFVKSGQKVVIKPNIGWNSTPERAHNTNPDLVEAVARMCKEAGAKVEIFDRTVNSARMCYRNSGIENAARRSGAKLSFMDSRKYKDTPVPKPRRYKTLPIYEKIINADVVINMPIAKTHGTATLTLGMKNHMGVLGGRRGIYHFDIDNAIVDFTKAVKVDLVILDATRILTAYGPNGGTDKDVKELRTIIMGTNQVTVDAYGATLFNMRPASLGYLGIAYREGMGEININRMRISRKFV